MGPAEWPCGWVVQGALHDRRQMVRVQPGEALVELHVGDATAPFSCGPDHGPGGMRPSAAALAVGQSTRGDRQAPQPLTSGRTDHVCGSAAMPLVALSIYRPWRGTGGGRTHPPFVTGAAQSADVG